ncbi:outer membrane OprD family porin [Kushneria sinocarnis]|uniref:Outer membrane OprD family porin n=1 Tax=Kushneria sinocarnis TaxID=595502 RepID=A0A420WWJ3_9GAMM|nr:OprD family outer membrane porin [Kushneria sinocarnis]RKR03474.1 outer membrane OprD family porin [Kushneria sinocarnis]
MKVATFQQRVAGAALTGLLITTLTASGSARGAQDTPATETTDNAPNAPTAKNVQARQADATRADAGPTASHGPGDMFRYGEFHGSLRTLYYSTHNAYFVPDNNQDTISYGGSLGFESARWQGFRFGISAIVQRGIDHPDDAHAVSELEPDETNIGEAYVSWQHGDFGLTAGNQRMQLPFASDYDWRVTPMLYQGFNLHYGDDEDFLQAARIYRYKSWGSDTFSRTTNYTDVEEETDGMWAVGAGHAWYADGQKWSGQLWHERYDDYVRISYAEGHVTATQGALQPLLGVQYIRGTSDGRALAGEVDNHTYGLQLGLRYHSLEATLNMDHIASSPGDYLNGALVTPYAHNSSSGPYFAQPFFTSTQDLGAGNAYSLDVTGAASEALLVGARYSFMDLKDEAGAASLNQSEYLLFGIYSFQGALEGFSIADYAGVQTSPARARDFWQNRVALQYEF